MFLCFSSFLSYNFFHKIVGNIFFLWNFKNHLIFCSKLNLKMKGWIMSSKISATLLTKFVLVDKVFCKHLHLVISPILDKIFQPFKEQKWCPSLGAPNFGVNSECFAQKLWIRSKIPNFGVTKNSADMGKKFVKRAKRLRQNCQPTYLPYCF